MLTHIRPSSSLSLPLFSNVLNLTCLYYVVLFCFVLQMSEPKLALAANCCHCFRCFQGLRKRELLREVLPVIGENLRFQRLFTEYQDQLELLRNK